MFGGTGWTGGGGGLGGPPGGGPGGGAGGLFNCPIPMFIAVSTAGGVAPGVPTDVTVKVGPCGVIVIVPVTVHDWPVVSVCEFMPGTLGGRVTWQKIVPVALVNVTEKVLFPE